MDDRARVEVERLLAEPFVVLGVEPVVASTAARTEAALAQRRVEEQLAAGSAAPGLAAFRTEAYRAAAVSFGDLWATSLVARAEELTAEAARRRSDWIGARDAWRSAWWIRRATGAPGGAQRDAVMALLYGVTGRWSEAKERLSEAVSRLEPSEQRRFATLWQLLSPVDPS